MKLTITTVKTIKPTGKLVRYWDTEIKGFMLQVSPAGTMTYYLRYRYEGKSLTYKIGRHPDITPTHARSIAQAKAGDVAKGIDIQADKKKAARQQAIAKKTTLKGYIRYVYKDHLLTERRTGAKILQSIQTHFGQWENKQLQDISHFLVANWRKQQLKAGKSPGTVNRSIAYLRALLNHAYHNNVIASHPLATFKQLREDKNKIVRYLLPDEETRLREALIARDTKAAKERDSANQWRKERGYSLKHTIQGYSDYLHPLVLLALNTGMRRGELFNLHWNDIDLKRRTLAIHGHNAKSGKTRHIPLNEEAFAVLVKWRNESSSKRYVFTLTGARLDNIKTAFGNVLKQAEIDVFRFHDLRHTFASKLAMRAVDLNTIRELLGHSDLQMTMRYAHLAPNVKAKAVELLS